MIGCKLHNCAFNRSNFHSHASPPLWFSGPPPTRNGCVWLESNIELEGLQPSPSPRVYFTSPRLFSPRALPPPLTADLNGITVVDILFSIPFVNNTQSLVNCFLYTLCPHSIELEINSCSAVGNLDRLERENNREDSSRGGKSWRLITVEIISQ